MTKAEIVGKDSGKPSLLYLSTERAHKRLEVGDITMQHGAFSDSPVTVWLGNEVENIEPGQEFTQKGWSFAIRHNK